MKNQQIVLLIKAEAVTCPICGGTKQIACPGEWTGRNKGREYVSCANGKLLGTKDYHTLCQGTSRVHCEFCNTNETKGPYSLKFVRLGEDDRKNAVLAPRFAFAVYGDGDEVMFAYSIRCPNPSDNGDNKMIASLWTKPASKFPK